MADWDALWARIEENRFDFETYTKLVQEAEAQLDMEKMRAVCDRFLDAFPLLYGYWKRYAEFEWTHGDKEAGTWRDVYERSVQAVPHSVDIWVYYCGAVAEREDDSSAVQELFERAVNTVGLDYLSGALWEKYAETMASKSAGAAVAVLRRAIAVPCNKVAELYRRAEELLGSASPADVLSSSELEEFTARAGAESAEGEVEEEVKRLIASDMATTFATSRVEAEKRQHFEDTLKRFYFTVTPVDEMQLGTWRAYLQFEEEQVQEGDYERLIALYERCIIPCCYYLEFWVRYARFLEKRKDDVDAAREVLTRAANKFMRNRPGPRLALADFEEAHGDAGAARQCYEAIVNEIAPTHLESLVKYANFEKRQEDLEKALDLYGKAVQASTDAQRLFVTAHAAQCAAQGGQADKARELLDGIKEASGDKLSFWMAYLSMEATAEDPSEPSRVLEVAESAKRSLPNPMEGKQIDAFLSEHFGFFSGSVASLREAEFRRKYASLSTGPAGSVAGQKRGREEFGGGDKIQKTAMGGVAPQSQMSYGGYGHQPQQPMMGGYGQPPMQPQGYYPPPQQPQYGGY